MLLSGELHVAAADTSFLDPETLYRIVLFYHLRQSSCIYRVEKQLRVWVHRDDFVPLRWFFVILQEFWVVTNGGIL